MTEQIEDLRLYSPPEVVRVMNRIACGRNYAYATVLAFIKSGRMRSQLAAPDHGQTKRYRVQGREIKRFMEEGPLEPLQHVRSA